MPKGNRRSESENPASNPNEWEEPVFADDPQHDDEPHFDEPVFDESDFDPEYEDQDYKDQDYEAYDEPEFNPSARRNEPAFDEEEFDYVPDPRVAESLAVGASAGGANMLSRQSRRAAQDAEAEGGLNGVLKSRRLGRTGPFWLMGAGALIVFLLILLLFFLRQDNNLTAEPELVTPAASGELGSVSFPATESISVTQSIQPTPTPLITFEVGQRVVVANTAGQGIRLRDKPSTAALTLDIFQDGDAFTILNSDSDNDTYPVEANGYRWYRIQVAGNPQENLTGWAAADFLQAAE